MSLSSKLQSPNVPLAPVEWISAPDSVPYPAALSFMEERAKAIHEGTADECVWLLEHPPLYTAGTSADPSELVDPERFPIFEAGRGGRYTYHGPGQRVAYVMLDLNARGRDVRKFVTALEEWLIATLGQLGVRGTRSDAGVGIFVHGAKIASIGVRIRRWVTFHGIGLNVSPDLEHFTGIVPCGLADTPVTSLEALGASTDMNEIDKALQESFACVFQTPQG